MFASASADQGTIFDFEVEDFTLVEDFPPVAILRPLTERARQLAGRAFGPDWLLTPAPLLMDGASVEELMDGLMEAGFAVYYSVPHSEADNQRIAANINQRVAA